MYMYIFKCMYLLHLGNILQTMQLHILKDQHDERPRKQTIQMLVNNWPNYNCLQKFTINNKNYNKLCHIFHHKDILTKCLSTLGRNLLLTCPCKSQYANSLGRPGINIPCIANRGLPISTTIAQKAS